MKYEEEFYIEDVVATGRRKVAINEVTVGDNVKVVLRLHNPIDSIDAERLWFKVLKVDEDNLLVELDNDPLYLKSISGTGTLNVTLNNILEVYPQ